MALEKTYASINFSGGRKAKSDSKLLLPGELQETVNTRLSKYDTIDQRYGYDGLNSFLVGGAVKEITDVVCPAATSITTGQYFTINSEGDSTAYYVWFNKASGGGDPAPSGKTAIEVAIGGSDTAAQVATALANAINAVSDFSAEVTSFSTSTVRIENLFGGPSTDAANVDVSGLTVRIEQQGAENPGNLGSSDALGVFGNELIQYKDSKLYSRLSSFDGVVEKGFVPQVVVNSKSVSRNTFSHLRPDAARSAQLECYVWYESSRGVRASVYDPSSDSFLVNDFAIASSGEKPRVVSLLNSFFVFYYESNEIKSRKLDLNRPTQFEAAVTFESSIANVDIPFDIYKTSNTQAFIAMAKSGSPNSLKIVRMNGDGLFALDSTITSADPDAIRIKGNESYIWVVWNVASTNNTNVAVFNISLTAILGSTNVQSSREHDNFAIEFLSSTKAQMFGSVVSGNAIDRWTIDTSGNVVYEQNWLYHCSIHSDAFQYDSMIYLPVALTNAQLAQSGVFVLDKNKSVIAKAFDESGPDDDQGVGRPFFSDDNKLIIPSLRTVLIQSTNNTLINVQATQRLELDFDNINRYFSEDLNKNLHTVGGVVTSYDSNSAFETGFNYSPAIISTQVITSGGSIITGTYSLIAIYEWDDEMGNVHRSAPSLPYEQQIASGAANQIRARVTSQVLTQRKYPRSDIRISLYATLAGGSVYRRTDDPSNPVLNDPDAESVTIDHGVSDASLLSNEILYTTGGVLPNFSPPSSSIIAVDSRRVYLADDDRVVYSKERIRGEGISFHPLLRFQVKKKVTGLAVLDEKIIIGSESELFYVSGRGPDNTGLNNDFSDPFEIQTDVGFSEQTSIVKTPEGLMFRSNKGIYLLDRSLGVSYVGADVEDFNDERILSATLIDDQNEVRFITESGVALVYNYFFRDPNTGLGKWQVYDNFKGTDAIIWQNSYVYSRSDSGKIFKENTSRFSDDGKPYSMVVDTGWIKVRGVQNISRVYRVSILGKFLNSHRMKVSVYYDYKETPDDILVWDAASEFNQPAYGEDSPYGEDDVPYGGTTDGVYQFRFDPPRQKVQAIRFRFEDINNQGSGASLSLSNMTLEVGVKRGIGKLKAGKRARSG